VIGAYNEDHDAAGSNFLSQPGSAYVFERDSNGTWMELQKIVASDRRSTDYFGFSVGISGDYVVIGAMLQDYDELGGNYVQNAGAIYLFEEVGGTWSEVSKIVPPGRSAQDRFGNAVGHLAAFALLVRRN